MSLIRIRAEIDLFSEVIGGRSKPIKSGYRPNHRFDEKSYYVGQIDFDDGNWHFPGEKNVVGISFMESPGLKERLNPGFEWDITEGSHCIGRGKVLYVE